MRKSRFTETRIVSILREVEGGRTVADACREYGIAPATYYNWKRKYGGMEAKDIKRMKELEEELAGKLEFAELDVDDPANQAKVQGAGVMSIPTFIIEKDGEEVDRKLGAMPKDAMMQWIQQCLEA